MARNRSDACKAFTHELVEASLHVLETSLDKPFTERQKGILLMYVDGATFEEIGDKFNCTVSNAYQVIRRLQCRMKMFDAGFYESYSALQERANSNERELKLLRHVKSVIHEENPKIGVRLKDCELPMKLYKALLFNFPAIETLQDLSRLTRSQLMSGRGIGRDSLLKIQELLASFGMRLQSK